MRASSVSELCAILNKEIGDENIKFKLDLIHETPIFNNGCTILEFLGYAETIKNDSNVLPNELKLLATYKNRDKTLNEVLTIKKWINDNIFNFSLNLLVNNLDIREATLLVRLRIAINMIHKTSLTKEEKLEWQNHLLYLFHDRKRIMYDYFYREILELPF